ncbi:hypothetical protein JIX56_40650 [Streptomyces sp. CA-210063]|uniref:hypothetical protein n=1 Tax=Streptomyces sp. CA-210063 TaxID=2801029 RepID=UPI00214A9233|nr:hypothetical protein [Streptomyces sp. CA-210063]UUU35659.1 hypothetical protein JIX56_40650 [Streptomyces sp. CA-210063]
MLAPSKGPAAAHVTAPALTLPQSGKATAPALTFPDWGTQRSSWRDHDVTVTGDTELDLTDPTRCFPLMNAYRPTSAPACRASPCRRASWRAVDAQSNEITAFRPAQR